MVISSSNNNSFKVIFYFYYLFLKNLIIKINYLLQLIDIKKINNNNKITIYIYIYNMLLAIDKSNIIIILFIRYKQSHNQDY